MCDFCLIIADRPVQYSMGCAYLISTLIINCSMHFKNINMNAILPRFCLECDSGCDMHMCNMNKFALVNSCSSETSNQLLKHSHDEKRSLS